MTTDIELTPELVREYLESLTPGQMAGERVGASTCPLARALRHAGATSVSVTCDGYELDGRLHNTQPFPAWALAFIRRVDCSGIPHSRVRAATALRILDEVVRETDDHHPG